MILRPGTTASGPDPMVLDLVVAGKPVGKGRPRLTKTGRAYTPRATTLAENDIRSAWVIAGSIRLPDGPTTVRVVVALERPTGHWLRDGTLSSAGRRAPLPDRQKPDLDNCAKLVLDALNGRAWRDDVQVVDLGITRTWDTVASTRIMAWPTPTARGHDEVR